MVRRDARIVVSHDSVVVDATEAALDLLGLTLAEIKALEPGAMSLNPDTSESAAFQAAWRESGGTSIVGVGTVRLLDGSLLRLRYIIEPSTDSTWEVIIEKSPEAVDEPPRTYTLGTVLERWRAAERQLSTIPPDSQEWTSVMAEVERFRTDYHRLSRTMRDRGSPE